MGNINDGSSGYPISLLLKVSIQSAGFMTLPLVRKTMNFVLEVFTAILLDLNHTAIFCNSWLTYAMRSFKFFPLDRQVVSSANNTENNDVVVSRSKVVQTVITVMYDSVEH